MVYFILLRMGFPFPGFCNRCHFSFFLIYMYSEWLHFRNVNAFCELFSFVEMWAFCFGHESVFVYLIPSSIVYSRLLIQIHLVPILTMSICCSVKAAEESHFVPVTLSDFVPIPLLKNMF